MAEKFDTVEEYVASFPTDVQQVLESIRNAVRAAAPDAVETISYQMPTFTLDGTAIVHFAAWKRHIGVYPIPAGSAEFTARMARYATDKATARFPLSEPVPYHLIGEMVTIRVNQLPGTAP